jgi:molybdenum cofactor biosynthesis enzyme
MGWPSCISTAPMPKFDASVSRINCLAKSGKAKTGAELRACFTASNACYTVSDQTKRVPFFNKSMIGLLIMP